MSDDTCRNCGQPVRIAIFRGSHYCSGQCLAALTGGTHDRATLPTAPVEQPPKPRQGRCVQ